MSEDSRQKRDRELAAWGDLAQTHLTDFERSAGWNPRTV
jgi:hypothetical protein